MFSPKGFQGNPKGQRTTSANDDMGVGKKVSSCESVSAFGPVLSGATPTQTGAEKSMSSDI